MSQSYSLPTLLLLAMKALFSDRRFLYLFVLIAAIAWFFWTSSRYPALDTKALMAGSLNMQDGLSFDAWLTHRDGESWFEKVIVTFLNWIYTNRQGMGFGLLFAVVAMSIVPLIQKHIYFRPSGWNASFMGFIFGAPLGVCVNCAAPIAYGLYKNGARAELAIATMISSPTFNIIVVSMLISMFAWPLVVIKLGITLLVIFALIPLLLKVFTEETYSTGGSNVGSAEFGAAIVAPPIVETDDNVSALTWTVRALWKNSIFLLIKVVPIMLLAGLLGTLVVSLAPWELLEGLSGIQGYVLVLITMLALSFFGLFLPVPIAFDIILAATLVSAGVPIKYVAVLLFTLGTFSVYSFMILWKSGARRVAISLYGCLVALGVVAGLASEMADEKYRDWEVNALYAQLKGDDVIRHEVTPPTIPPAVVNNAPIMSYRSHSSSDVIEQLPLSDDNQTLNTSQFQMTALDDAGFLLHERPLVELLTESLALTAGLAAGDVNGDNWVDVLVGTANGVYLYINTGGHFSPVALPFQNEVTGIIGANGLQDFNNDGTLDLYYSVVNEGGYISYNQGGTFTPPRRLYEHNPLMNTAVGFGDVDHNGELDIVEAYHSGLAYRHISLNTSKNRLFLQNNGLFESQLLSGNPGETLTLLLSDINSDGWLDLMVGNDFDERDVYYWGGEGGTLTQWADDSVFTTESSMSIDSADINNDLRLESYHGQITRNPASPPAIIPEKPVAQLHADMCAGNTTPDLENKRRCENLVVREISSWNRGANGCSDLPASLKHDCIAARWYTAARSGNVTIDNSFLERWYPEYARMYNSVYGHKMGKIEQSGLSQKLDTNMLYQYGENYASITDNAQDLGIDITGWTWNARFADLDGDEWQDIFVANGTRAAASDTTNVWFKNNSGTKFEQATEQVGLVDYEPTSSSLYLDIDNDSDLDLVSFSQSGKIKTYLNTGSNNAHIQIELNDSIGNRRGIGSKVIIRYGDGAQQIREIKGSGGYFSQDASVMHFGLGQHSEVDDITIQWSTGEQTHHEGPFNAQTRYRISRK